MKKTRIILGDAITLLNEYIEDESISYLSILLIISAKNSPNFQDRREDEGNYIL